MGRDTDCALELGTWGLGQLTGDQSFTCLLTGVGSACVCRDC